MRKEEKQVVWKAINLLRILKGETDKQILKDEIERIEKELRKTLDD